MKPIGTKQVKEFDFPLASKAKAKSEEKREIEAQVTDPVTPEELDVDMTDYNFDWKGRSKKAQASFQKYVDLAFGNKGERPRHRIPANPEDDDLFVSNYIRESSDRIAQLEAIIEDTRMDALRDHWSMYAPINDEAALAFAHIMDKPHHALSVVNELCQKAAVLTRDDIVGIMGNLQAAGVAAYLSEGILGRTKRASVSVRVQGKEIVSTEYACPSGDIDNRSKS